MTWRASSGLRAWIIQRITAAYLAVFIIYLCLSLTLNAPANWHAWRAWVAHPMVNTGLGLFFLAMLFHAWIGLRDIIMDYVQSFALRLIVLVMVGVVWVAMGLWSVRILFLVSQS